MTFVVVLVVRVHDFALVEAGAIQYDLDTRTLLAVSDALHIGVGRNVRYGAHVLAAIKVSAKAVNRRIHQVKRRREAK